MGRRWRIGSRGYVIAYENGGTVWQHREVWAAANGPIPAGHQIHHINGDRADNRIENLECLTPGQHRRTHAAERIVVHCEACGVDVEGSAQGAPLRFCTRCTQRRGDAKRPLVERQCRHCGATFTSKWGGTFCSQRCVNLGARHAITSGSAG